MLRVRVLGELAVTGDAGASVPRARPARSLLAWLALHPGAHPRALVASRLWPDTLDRSARTNLRGALLDLRRALAGDADGALLADGDTIALDARVDRRDVVGLLRSGRAEEALAIADGELLPGADEDWILQERERHRHDVVAAHEALAAAADASGDQAGAVARTREQLRVDPLDEEVVRRLMDRLVATGNRSAALETYDAFATRLRRALAVAPSAATRELAATLRREAPVATSQVAFPPELTVIAKARPPLVGREAELATLRDAWGTLADRPVAIAVRGEPGVGKTRLVAALAAELHEQGTPVLFGRCDEEGLLPYAPFAEAIDTFTRDGTERVRDLAGDHLADLARMVPVLGAATAASGDDGATGEQRLRLHAGVLAVLQAVAPAVLVIDDAHWLDAHSTQLLRRLLRASSAPLLILLTVRSTERSAAAGIEQRALELGGLDPSETERFVRSLDGHADVPGGELHAATAGNPLYLGELVRHRAQARPAGGADTALSPTLLETIGERVSRLGDAVGEALAAAAVAGERFELHELATATGTSPSQLVDALDAATAAGIVIELPGVTAGRYAFVHGLMRHALYGRLSATRRALLHDAFAGAVDEERVVARAEHALRGLTAARDDAGVDLVLAAARRHVELFAYEEAAALLARACAGAREADVLRRIELRLALGGALQRAGRPGDAAAPLREALALARGQDDRARVSRALLALGGLGTTIVAPDRDLIDDLERAAAEATDDDERALLLGRLSIELHYTDDDAGRDAASAEAVALARRAGRPATLAAALVARRVALWAPDHLDERLELSTAAADVAVTHGLAELELEARTWRYVDLVSAGRMDEARDELGVYEDRARERRLPRFAWYATLWRASLALASGDLDASHALAAEAVAEGHAAGDPNADVFDGLLAGERIDRGSDDFAPMLAMLENRSRSGLPSSGAYLAGMAYGAAMLGRREQARDLLGELAADGFARVPRDSNRLSCLGGATSAAWEIGDATHAAGLSALLEPYADQVIVQARAVHLLGSCETFLGRLAFLLGDLDGAVERIVRGLGRDDAAGLRTRATHARHDLAAVLLRRDGTGDAAEARVLLDRVAADAAEMGLDGLLARVPARG